MDREQIFRQLDEYCRERFIELGKRHLKRPVLKSYVIETRRDLREAPVAALAGLGTISQQDEDIYSIIDSKGPVGILERQSRFIIFHTLLKTSEIEPKVLGLVRKSVLTDNLWLDGDFLRYLFDMAVRIYGGERYSGIAMEFEPYFEVSADNFTEDSDECDIESGERVRPLNRVAITLKLDKLSRVVERLGEIDFFSLTMTRFPSSTSGGHEFYSYGKVTNRSDGFYAHRNIVKTVLEGYRVLTEHIEDLTWFGGETDRSPGGIEAAVEGAPVIFQFEEEIPSNVYRSFIDMTFVKMRGPFRLVGNLIRAGKERYHVYGLDMHLGQRIFLEISPKRFIVILPNGTCGNTVHRLAVSIQRYLTQKVKITVGHHDYRDLVREAFAIGLDKTN